jgi:hypothetical protein
MEEFRCPGADRDHENSWTDSGLERSRTLFSISDESEGN